MKTKLWITVAISLAVGSCSTSLQDDLLLTSPSHKNQLPLSQNRSLDEALQIAASVRKQARTTDGVQMVSYIVNNATMSRSISITSDTLAYIINEPDNKGFTIVAFDNRVDPLLAYSDSGNFEVPDDHNHFINQYFVDLLPEYVANSVGGPIVIGGNYDITYPVPPIIKFKGWQQDNEFAKYIQIEHPNYPVGCVALAYVRVGLMVADSITWKGETFNLKGIRDSLLEYSNTSTESEQINQNYSNAIDRVAKLLYYFDEIYAIFEGGTTKMPAYKGKARFAQMFDKHVYPSNYSEYDYNSEEMIDHILSGSIIIMQGTNLSETATGHQWIIDGGAYSIQDPSIDSTKKYSHVLFKCDWGWNELFNGYYSGEVFKLYNIYDSETIEYGGYKDLKYSYIQVN